MRKGPKQLRGAKKLSTEDKEMESMYDVDVEGSMEYDTETGGLSTPPKPAVPSAVDATPLPDVIVVGSAQQWRAKWWNTIVECAGAVAGCCTTAAFIPQVVDVYVTGDTSGLSLPMYCIFVMGVLMWIVYGVCKRAGAMIGANVVTFALAGYILYRILDNEIFSAAVEAAPMLPPAPPSMPLPPSVPPLPPSMPLDEEPFAPSMSLTDARRALRVLEQARATRLWRALAAI